MSARKAFPGVGGPLGDGIYEAVRRHTRMAFGFAINLHRFRHAAATSGRATIPRTSAERKTSLVNRHSKHRKALHHGAVALAGRALARAIGR
jgi:hypothetical protein